MANATTIPADPKALREKLTQDGREYFDAQGWIDGSRSPWQPNDREHYARAYAAIAMPLGSANRGVVA